MEDNFAELPEGWAWTTYEQIGKWSGGGTPSKQIESYWIEGEIPWISPKDMKSLLVRGSEDKITDDAIENSSAKLIPSGSLLFVVRSGILRRTLPIALTRIDAAVNQDLKALTPSDHIFAEYLLYHALAFNNEIRRSCSKDGTTVESLEFSALKEYPVPVAPLPEQHRIVARIEELFSRLDAGVQALRRARAQLQRYRQSVLQAAVTGRLTAEWRAAHPEVEPAEKLLKRIKENKYNEKRLKVAHDYDLLNLPKLPVTWIWTTIEQVSNLVTDGDHNPPKRTANGIPHLTARNIKNWSISEEGCTYICQADFEIVRKRYNPLVNDVIVTCVGTVGRTAIVPEGYTFSADRNLAAVRLVPKGMEPKFLQYNLNTSASQTAILGASGSTAQPHFYLGDIRAFPVALAPIEEQQEIISEIEHCFSIIDELEVQFEVNMKRSNCLRQSILQRAFEGKLVPQDPSDEPASLLLERIRAERIKTSQPSGRGRSPKTNQVSLIQ